MSPARIPEGSVFVARRAGENVAAQLLEAAEQIGADRFLSVRTTTGGYHVWADVAEQYQANLPEEEEVEEEEEDDESTPSKTIEEEEAEAEAKRLAAEAAAAAADAAKVDAAKAADGDAGNGEQTPEPIGVTLDNTRGEIDDYASKLTPPVDTTKAANKPDAIKLIEEARKTPAAE